MSPARAMLVAAPWMSPGVSNLAFATLRPILEDAGFTTETLFASLLFPRSPMPQTFFDTFGGMVFVPYVFPNVDREELVESIVRACFELHTLYGIVYDDPDSVELAYGMTREQLRARVRDDIRLAGVCLDRCFVEISRRSYDVVGFSLMFETQIPAAVALAVRLKQHCPEAKIAFGGAACVEEQADGLLTSFPVIDAVCHGEGERVIVPMFRALVGELPLDEVRGVAWRDPRGEVHHNRAPELIEDLDELPIPRFDDYLAALARSEWRGERVKLFFETSRGCWWGQKHLCTFCGMNADGLIFRAKSPERAYTEIEHLYRSYPQARQLIATDNILDTRYFTTLLPRLARMPRDPARPLNIFFEIKSNIKPHEVALLRVAGILMVQPGIETFDDQILEVMDKGSTAAQQIQFIKWAYAERVLPMYNLLLYNPGEDKAAYQRMLDLLPFIEHLPPPSGITPMMLERFSPYFDRPAEFGVRGRRPRALYRHLYPDPNVDVERIAYKWEYEHAMFEDPEHRALVRAFTTQVLNRWRKGWKPMRLYFIDRGDHLEVHDRRGEAEAIERIDRIDGIAAAVYRYVDVARPFDSVTARFADVPPGELRALLDTWHERRWSHRSADDRHLAVVPHMRPELLSADEVLAALPAPPAPATKRTDLLPVVA